MYNRGFMKDMDKMELLKMREGGMSNVAIAKSLGCGERTVRSIIGPMPPEMQKKIRQEGMARAREAKLAQRTEGGYSVERKMKSFMPQHEEERVKAVLVMKPMKMPIPLRGEFMHYVIGADRDVIDVETEQGRALIQIPADKLDTFIAELTAIQKNIGAEKPMQFWG